MELNLNSLLKQNFEHLKLEIRHEAQLWITLNNPDKMNAISSEMIESLIFVMYAVERFSEIRCVVIKGEGPSAFSAGGDVSAMRDRSGMFQGNANELRERYMQGIQKIPKCFEEISKPVIAMVNGAAVGAGCDLAMMCDLRVGSEKSRLGETFAKLNLIPGDGGSYFLIRAVGFAKAMQMTLTAEMYQGEAAFKFGLLHYYVENQQLEKFTEDLAQKMTQLPPMAVQMAKKGLRQAYRSDLSSHLDMMAAYQGIAQNDEAHRHAVEQFFNKSPAK